jgi:hypothetical protein
MKQIYSFLRYIALFPIALLLTTLISKSLIRLDHALIPSGGGFDINLSDAGTMFFALTASFTFLLFLAVEKIRFRNHILVIVILMLILSISLDPTHFYFPAGLILAGAGLGFALRTVISKTIGTTVRGESLKRFF